MFPLHGILSLLHKAVEVDLINCIVNRLIFTAIAINLFLSWLSTLTVLYAVLTKKSLDPPSKPLGLQLQPFYSFTNMYWLFPVFISLFVIRNYLLEHKSKMEKEVNRCNELYGLIFLNTLSFIFKSLLFVFFLLFAVAFVFELFIFPIANFTLFLAGQRNNASIYQLL